MELDLIGVADPFTSAFTKIAAHPTLRTTGPNLSPDGKWLVFHTAEEVKSSGRLVQGKRQIFIAPFRGQWIPLPNWIPVTDGTAPDREANGQQTASRCTSSPIATGSAAYGPGN